MKKVFDQTVRDIKRGVNKKVLKVPGVEQKVLDATSNEPWGPHGTLLAEIAQATRNYHEYQMIMSVLWKRINDTGKNWRHVYKGLTVLEYLVAHGSERVIDEIREHSYQLSTLSDFQYIDSSGRDQGSNVRKKSQGLVALVNDKERLIEVRQKAAANRDKFRTASTGGMYKPGSYSGSGGYGDRYDYDRYEGRHASRDDDQNGYGREREYGYKDDDRYGKNGDSYREGDRYGRDYEDRSSRDGYRDDEYRGRSRSVDGYQDDSRGRSSDRYRAFDDDGQSSSRGSGARADDHSQEGRRLERKFSEQNVGAPPSYEEAISESRSPVQSERDGETSAPAAPGASSPAVAPRASPPASHNPSQSTNAFGNSASLVNQEVGAFDEFDPRGAVPASATTSNTAAPTASNSAEMDFLGSLSDSFSSNVLAIMPATSATTTNEADAIANSGSVSTYNATHSASNVMNQSFEDPFGDGPFRAIPSTDVAVGQQQISASASPFHPTSNQFAEMSQPAAPKVDSANNFGDPFYAITYSAPTVSNVQSSSTNSQFLPQELSTSQQDTDILADILPPPSPSPSAAVPSQVAFSAPTGQPAHPSGNMYGSFTPPGGSTAPVPSYMAAPAPAGPAAQFNGGIVLPHQGFGVPAASQMTHQTSSGPATQNSDLLNNLLPQSGSNPPMTSQPAFLSSSDALAIVPQPQPSKEKFEPKSAVWADTLSRGLVNLNISGSKINPLADIGIDFDAINRKEKRMEKQPAQPAAVTSTITMGKAMGSGSGIGRAGASALRPTQNSMMGSGMGMGMGMGMGTSGGPGAGMGMGGYGGMNQQPMGMGMGMNNMPMGMNMGMAQGGVQMQPQIGMPPGPGMPGGGYRPMMGASGYPPQQQQQQQQQQQPYGQPYGGGYR